MYLTRISPEESDRLLNRALDLGINYFDTASAYMDSEEKLGRVLAQRRAEYHHSRSYPGRQVLRI